MCVTLKAVSLSAPNMNASRRFALFLACIIAMLPSFAARAATNEVSNFALLDQRGKLCELRRMNGSAVVLFFTANGCPVARQNTSKFNALRERYATRGIEMLMVNSSSDDTRPSIAKEMRELRAPFMPVLKDDTQGVARHLG